MSTDRVGGRGSAGEIGDAVVDGARISGDVLGLHEIPDPLPDPPLPRLGVAASLLRRGCSGSHGRAGLCVKANSVGLERGRIERRGTLHSPGAAGMETPREGGGEGEGAVEGGGGFRRWVPGTGEAESSGGRPGEVVEKKEHNLGHRCF